MLMLTDANLPNAIACLSRAEAFHDAGTKWHG